MCGHVRNRLCEGKARKFLPLPNLRGKKGGAGYQI